VSPWRGYRLQPAHGRSFWGRFLLLWLAASGLGTLLLFLFHYLYLTVPFPESYTAVYHALGNLARTMPSVIVLSLLAYVFFLGGVSAWLSITSLHKVAGPMFGLEKVLRSYLDGASVRPFFMRHGDLVPELVSAFNRFVGRLREDRQKWTGVLENAERLTLQDRATRRAEMERALKGLVTLLSRYH